MNGRSSNREEASREGRSATRQVTPRAKPLGTFPVSVVLEGTDISVASSPLAGSSPGA